MLKWFFLKIRFLGDIREICNSAQANSARSFAGIHFVCAGLSANIEYLRKNEKKKSFSLFIWGLINEIKKFQKYLMKL